MQTDNDLDLTCLNTIRREEKHHQRVEKPTTTWCKKLNQLPAVNTVWQQTTWRPDCDYYRDGRCSYPECNGGNVACLFDGYILPLREAVETPDDQPRS